ncbi:restriction endonuclease subunit S [Aquipseudomonas alcaligenes]|uniref:Restriction endonuclease subunit S n=1 Tax=Aquipseudomonas alcaligenes TaxID=43263 RepID=A0AA42N402_AQUAC|nr:restriction endonuclease subunit S [Pseudomonas alcaligenes]MDH1057056.1 restriction endonuclease subunit S [Pseudomonas alcaligenes]
MTFTAYPDYKPSGFDWLPEVPAHWMDRKIARDIPFVVGWTPPSGKDEYYDGDLPWVTIADMTQVSVEDTKSKISHLAVQDKGAKVVPAGSMLFSFKLSVGKIAFLTIDSYTNEAIAGFLPCGPLDLEYWKYAAPEFIPRYGRENIYGATLLNQELISSVRFFAPARAEQTQIARFLDHETARIDALIEEQQRLIELLKEKRQAVISHAVTKGLDPTVPMKDSGVEWLGEVPAHWDVKALRRVLKKSLSNGVFKKKEDFGRGVLLVNVFDVYRQNFQVNYSSLDRVDCNAAEISSYSVLSGDLFFVRSSLKYEGIAVVAVAGECSEPVVYECHLICARPDPAVFNGRYGSYLFNSSNYRATMISKSKLTTMTTIDQEAISSTLIPAPPLSEQAEISVFLDREINKVDQLIGEADSVCELLKERRSALISAAVTGKIDVRGWQPPASSQAPEPAVAEAV